MQLPYETAQELPPDLRLLLARVYLRTQRRAAWRSYLLEETVVQEEESFGPYDTLDAECAWREEHAGVLDQHLIETEKRIEQLDPSDSRWAQLCHDFSLTPLEQDIVQTCLAYRIDPDLGPTFFNFLQAHEQRVGVTLSLVARLFDYGFGVHWSVNSTLRRWNLIEEVQSEALSSRTLHISRLVCSWLQGHDDWDESLVRVACSLSSRPVLSQWPLEDAVAFARERLRQKPSVPVCIQLVGSAGSGRRTFASCIAEQLGYQPLYLQTGHLSATNWQYIAVQAQLQARLMSYALVWDCSDVLNRSFPNLPLSPVHFVIGELNDPPTFLPHAAHFQIAMPELTVLEREQLWATLLPTSQGWPEEVQKRTASAYRVTVGDIVTAARQGAISPDEALEVVRLKQKQRLGNLAQHLPCPFVWKDLVVHDSVMESLQELVFEAKERTMFWEKSNASRLFPRGRGLVAMLSGPPGTGKTMAAQIIASSLSMDLYRIDLSTVVSKYIGETSKNLERILSQASQMNVVLLFDEADALFGKRTEVKDSHDRFANMDINHLLQAIETYEGIALLASNKGEQIDGAMLRRLRYILHFPAPTEEKRLQIWEQVGAELLGEGQSQELTVNYHRLSKDFKLTGAQIKAALLNALFSAKKEQGYVKPKHLIHGIHRELSKEGRPLTSNQLRNYL